MLLEHLLVNTLHFVQALLWVSLLIAGIKFRLKFFVNSFLAFTHFTVIDPLCVAFLGLPLTSFYLHSIVMGSFACFKLLFEPFRCFFIASWWLRIAHLQHFCYQLVNVFHTCTLLDFICECFTILVLWSELSIDTIYTISDLAVVDPICIMLLHLFQAGFFIHKRVFALLRCFLVPIPRFIVASWWFRMAFL